MSRGGAPKAVAAAGLVTALACLVTVAASSLRPDAAAPVPERLTLEGFFGSRLTPVSQGSFGLSRMQVLPERDPAVGPVLRVAYPAGSASQLSARTSGSPEGGAQLFLTVPEPAERAHLRYYVRFPPGFDFVRGGKLPGLYGGSVTSGREIPDGTDGFSTRYMWRAGGAGEVYTYLPSSKEHGTSLGRRSWSFATGRWLLVEQAVRLNDPGRDDGQVTVWVDGRQVYRRDGLRFRTVDRLKVEGLFFSTFFGGGDPSWASPLDQHADFAAFAVSPDYIGPLTAAG